MFRHVAWLPLCALLLSATGAVAQTATPTPANTSTPTSTSTAIPAAAAPPAGKAVITTLLAVANTTPGPSIDVRNFAHANVQISTSSTCSSYTLVIEGASQPLNPVWAPLLTITQATLGANASQFTPLVLPMGWIRARLSSVTSCTVTVALTSCASC